MSIFNKGAFVQYNWRYYVILDVIVPVIELPVTYILEDLVTKAIIETVPDVQIILEKLFQPVEGMKVIYNDTVWTVENVEVPDSLSGTMYQIKRNNALIAVDREDFEIFNPYHHKHLLEQKEVIVMKSNINVGDFVTCLYTAHVCIILDIKKDGLSKIESIVDKHTYGVSVRDLALVQEQDIDPEIGTRVIYQDQLWTICANMRTDYKDGNWKVYDLKNESGGLTGLEREQFTIYNPVIENPLRFVDLTVEDKVDGDAVEKAKANPIITTGSFVYHKTKDKYGVVIESNGDIFSIKDLVNEDIGFLYQDESDHLEVVQEESIELRSGMKIIYDGCVGTFISEEKGYLHIEEYPFGLIAADCEIFNPYFHDYEEKNGVKILKLRDFVDAPLKSFNETLYYMGVDPFENVMENLGCSESFPIEMLKKKIDYKDFVKMAENDAESFDNGEGSEDDLTYKQEVFEYKAGYSEEIDERNLLLNSLKELQTYLNELDPKSKFSNEDFCKGISEALCSSIAINFINKIIVRGYGQKVVFKLIFNGYSTQISFTISTREDSKNYVVKLLVFDNFKCKESFTGDLSSAFKYFVNLINSQDLNKSLFDKPDEDPFEEELPFKPIDQKVGLKQSEGKLMVQELYWPFIEQMTRVMTINKEKYPPKNYFKPMDKEELLAAAQRHQLSMWLGEEIDPTDGQPHTVKVATNMMMYYAQLKLYPNA
jgi:hypothetical protein